MNQKQTIALILLLLGGITLLAGGAGGIAISLALGSQTNTTINGLTPNGNILFGSISIVCGVVLFAISVMVSKKPERAKTWGIIGIVFSAIGLLSGSYIGAALALIGAILLLTYKH